MPAPLDREELHHFLVKAGTLLHRYGTPSHRLERVMSEVATAIGVESVFLYTPTALIVALESGENERTYLRRVDAGPVDVDKLLRFDETLDDLRNAELTVKEASRKFDEIAASPPTYSATFTLLTSAITCGVVAILFRGTTTEVLAATSIGLVINFLEILHLRFKLEHGFLQPFSGFFASLSALAIAHYIAPIDDRLVTLASLIVMIPGLSITVALTELAVGHLSAGVARLAGSCVSLLTMTIGVALGWRLAIGWRNLPIDPAGQLPTWSHWLAMVVGSLAFAVVFRARWPQWPVIVCVAAGGYLASYFTRQALGIETGAFCGALAVGIGSNLYARLRERPALVALTPGLLVLVPGSIGYRSLTAFLDRQTLAGIDFAFSMVIVAAALVGGILAANVILPPKRVL
ncbi:threonine/serine exporter family protein [Aureliella helgolandensis]|uniref:Inner membrane protein YjjP n=1 Tax=Aureliella helgolandensis TaxID=2527968 RepID=A0A518GCJ0_9BACT|nr:threonine/serine exporter family protein [Aureliella helgolandensis]QDV26309.1 hypothetical protein Q31a_46810 [Aureliella helgolandensis]